MYKKLPETNDCPQLDECRYLILKLIEQAVRDYLSLEHSSAPIERYYYETATDFIFSDQYTIDYGGTERSLQDLLDILDIDVVWFRERVIRLKDRRARIGKARLGTNVTEAEFDLLPEEEDEDEEE